VGKFCPHPKFARKEVGEEKDFVFLPAPPQKRGSRLGAQATEDTEGG